MEAVAKEPMPATPEAKEKYFMEQVAAGEQLCNAGKNWDKYMVWNQKKGKNEKKWES